ncbi:MAG: hypothetical protein JXR58_13585 [Bacteroidales bacterium]|nr:hypothetical protein [Bacteroidales bacterium]
MKNLLIFAVLAGILAFSSCKNEPPKAVIKVINENGTAVSGAEVKITADEGRGFIQPDNVKELFLTTNSSGLVERTFETDAIYDVFVQEYDESEVVVRSGSGVLVLVEDKTITETITIRP